MLHTHHPRAALGALTLLAAVCGTAWAQTPATSAMPALDRATASAVAQQAADQGIPLADLAPNAPDHYVVKRGGHKMFRYRFK